MEVIFWLILASAFIVYIYCEAMQIRDLVSRLDKTEENLFRLRDITNQNMTAIQNQLDSKGEDMGQEDKEIFH